MMLCYNCFQEYDETAGTACPHCGFQKKNSIRLPNHLPCGTMLQNHRYLIGEVCGKGGFGVIYKAQDITLGTIVAIKEYFHNELMTRAAGETKVKVFQNMQKRRMFREQLSRFLAEARIMARYATHPNIVNVFNYFEENGTAYIVMEFMDGMSLYKYLQKLKKENQKIDTEKATEIIFSVCRALETLHKDGILHRDISPDNIYLCNNGAYKLFDFGAAYLTKEETQSNAKITKPGYSPPEQYESVTPQGAWTDIYALGATLYRMLTGVIPTESTNRLKKDDMPQPVQLVPDIPVYLNNAIMKAMAIDIHYRFQNVNAFASALKQEVRAEIPAVTETKKKWTKFLSLGISIVLIAVCGTISAFRLHRQVQENTLPDGNIEIWYISENTELETALQEIQTEFCNNYENVSVHLVGIPEKEYSERLRQAENSNTMPALFQSDGIKTENFSVRSVDTVLNHAEIKNCQFFQENKNLISESKKIPLGFSIAVFYLNNRCSYDKNDITDISAVMNSDSSLSISENRQEIFEQWFGSVSKYQIVPEEEFLNGNADVLFSDTSELPEIRTALTGQFRMLPADVQGFPCFLTNCWSLGNSGDTASTRIAERFLTDMLSDRSQEILYLLHQTEALPISKAALADYADVYLEFQEIADSTEQYVFAIE